MNVKVFEKSVFHQIYFLNVVKNEAKRGTTQTSSFVKMELIAACATSSGSKAGTTLDQKIVSIFYLH